MKKLFTVLAVVLLTASVFAQAPEKISYQAVIRDGDNNLITNQSVGIRLSILEGSIYGASVYVETHILTTNVNGLASLEIGEGTVEHGNFSSIDWSDGTYFIKTETDPTGGASYTITGVSEMLSVPYALHAKTAETLIGGVTETDPTVPAHVKDIETDDIDNWNEAYGWGDHSAEGYLTDYIVTEGDVIAHQEALEITESQIADFGDYIETENDPVFMAWDKDYEDLTNKPDLTVFVTTSDMNTALDNKVDKETGKSLQSEGTQVGEIQYWNGSAWVTVTAGNSGQVLTLVNGVPTWTGTFAGTSDVVNSVTGKIWMDRNLGASQVAISSTDEDAYGDLYQWGRASDGHEKRNSDITDILSDSDTPGHGDFITSTSDANWDWRSSQNDNLWQGTSGTNNPCPSGYRLPTEAEWNAERQSWSSNNAAGAFASPLKLSLAGFRLSNNGSISNTGSFGSYCSSTVSGTFTRHLYFFISSARIDSGFRAGGRSVRCLKDF